MRAVITEPARPHQRASTAQLRSQLCAPPTTRWLLEELARYYRPDSPTCGVNFLDGSETAEPYSITAADLLAISALGPPLHPAATRRLLHDTESAAAVSAALRLLPPSLDPWTVTRRDLMLMRELHETIRAAISPASTMTASALCARKRPELFAVLDRPLLRLLGLFAQSSLEHAWRTVHDAIRDESFMPRISELFRRTSREAGVPVDIFPTRQLNVVATLLAGHVPAT